MRIGILISVLTSCSTLHYVDVSNRLASHFRSRLYQTFMTGGVRLTRVKAINKTIMPKARTGRLSKFGQLLVQGGSKWLAQDLVKNLGRRRGQKSLPKSW